MHAHDLSWEPVSRGDAYCSPRCGFGCTKAGYDRAVAEASALAIRLGDGWAPSVWENAGWHYEAVNGIARVKPELTQKIFRGESEVERYSAWIDFPGKQFIQHADTAEDALGFATQEARTFAVRLTQALDDLASKGGGDE